MKELILNTDSMIVLLVTVLLAGFAYIAKLHGEVAEIKHTHGQKMKELKGESDSALARETAELKAEIRELEKRLRTAEMTLSNLYEVKLYQNFAGGQSMVPPSQPRPKDVPPEANPPVI